MTDKIYHIVFGALMAAAIGLPVYANSHDLFGGIWGCLAGVIAGGVKEWCDNKLKFNAWNWKDFGFTSIGVAAAMLFIILMHVAKG